MIQTQTIVDVVDNSGVKTLRCIKVLGGFKKRYGVFGNLIRASIQELRQKGNKKLGLKKGDLVFAVVVQTRSQLKRKDGQVFKFFKNSAVIVDKQMKPLATRVLTPLCNELRHKKSIKLLSLAPSIL
ncbi:50S ribosomal protein L14 (mitochondrion) [Aureococcus anophagefferens]|jgi:large subunit ribosomal protein L14|uniref:Ribosomal protein L14 n=1 Tax=Aureococcus anophagefferens TaxID=44056 RepID=A0A649UDC7_AURAN|nr:50S ribosomal protein L14 [Aureococcus anophagefferens]MDA9172990.1 50S ribosomal protein L14 [bacterium]KAH8042933.1 50S ribosomal protein L14 [Aureococcus anophagefferens]KAH8043173.1 50S ribosomal protein L14 [Aureococcus anophagefferens]QGI24647.1 ribosomal protein L14 [Aureococcus anophagefferens]|tara:strand:+ start:16606 stop:16986 length:381 start_codon:yes stop_codon:yes gene_type:complete